MTSVAPPVVFDTNSLWNFAVVERMDILEARYGDRVTWTESIEDEVRTAERYESRLALVSSTVCPWLGRPRVLAGATCLTDMERIRTALAAPGDRPTKHLGEAECIHYIQHELGGDAWFVTDDVEAADMAALRGIRVLSTPDVLRECFSNYELACPEPFALLCQMADEGRGVYVPESHSAVC